MARRARPRWATPARGSPRSSGSTSFYYLSNIYSLAPGRDVVARGRASLFALPPSPRGPKSRGRFFRRVERGRGHSDKKPGKRPRERPRERSSTKSYLADTPARDLLVVRSGRRPLERSLPLSAYPFRASPPAPASAPVGPSYLFSPR